jgi:hypothetical protein
MVEDSPTLRSMSKVYQRNILVHRTRSVYRVHSADVRTKQRGLG